MPESLPLRQLIGDVTYGLAFRLMVLGGVAWLLWRLGWTTALGTSAGWVLGMSFAPVPVEVWRYFRSPSPDR